MVKAPLLKRDTGSRDCPPPPSRLETAFWFIACWEDRCVCPRSCLSLAHLILGCARVRKVQGRTPAAKWSEQSPPPPLHVAKSQSCCHTGFYLAGWTGEGPSTPSCQEQKPLHRFPGFRFFSLATRWVSGEEACVSLTEDPSLQLPVRGFSFGQSWAPAHAGSQGRPRSSVPSRHSPCV